MLKQATPPPPSTRLLYIGKRRTHCCAHRRDVSEEAPCSVRRRVISRSYHIALYKGGLSRKCVRSTSSSEWVVLQKGARLLDLWTSIPQEVECMQLLREYNAKEDVRFMDEFPCRKAWYFLVWNEFLWKDARFGVFLLSFLVAKRGISTNCGRVFFKTQSTHLYIATHISALNWH